MEHSYSNDETATNEVALAVLVACHHRGPLALAELWRLLSQSDELPRFLEMLVAQGGLERQGQRFATAQKGRDYLDEVLEGIERRLAPDDPAYMRRYRRASPTLPFDANTVWAEAVAVNVRVSPSALRPLIPEMFDPDLYQGAAFVSLTASRLKDFGVGWLPRAVRMNFYQATYRAHVVYTDFRGRRMRGCYFIRSGTNSQLMSLTANLLPEFRAHHCETYPIVMARRGAHLLLTVDSGADPSAKVVLVLDTKRRRATMPDTSIFPSRDEAYRFLIDFRDAFSYDPETGEILILQIERGEWDIQIVEPFDHYLGYFSDGPFAAGATELDSVFYFSNVPYRWLPLLKEKIRHRR